MMTDQSERIGVHCTCGKNYKVALHLAGKEYKCPKCNAHMLVPDLAHATLLYSAEDNQWLASVKDPRAEVRRLTSEIEDATKSVEYGEAKVKECSVQEEQTEKSKIYAPLGCLALIGVITLVAIIMDFFNSYRKHESADFWRIGPILLFIFILLSVPTWFGGNSALQDQSKSPSLKAQKILSAAHARLRLAERHRRMLVNKHPDSVNPAESVNDAVPPLPPTTT